MLLLSPPQAHELRPRFLPDRPGPLVGLHVLQTGNGACFTDRWPDPRAVLVNTAGNYALTGHPNVLNPDDLVPHIAGVVEAPDDFAPLLRAAFPTVQVWERVILELRTGPRYQLPGGITIRRLQSEDAYHLWGVSAGIAWISKTWGGPAGLASSGLAWGAFVQGTLVSVAVTFFAGDRYEDIGVVTEPAFRGRGLSAACAGGLARDIQARGRMPSWSTSPDNTASLRVAEKLGFQLNRHDRLYVIGIPIPESARRNTA